MTEASPLQKTAGSSPTALHGCPGREELLAFNRGTLPLAVIKSVAAHIKQCPLCEANLSTLQEDGETRHAPAPPASPADQQVNVQIENSARSVLVDLPIDFSRSAPSRLAKGSSRILEAPLQLGQYRLMEKIGQGGMGVVYKAWHERLKREVAIKLLPLDEFDDARGIERFHQEMAAVGNVRHANVVFATDAGESEGVHFLVMEYVQGIDLAKLAARLHHLAVADACELIRQAAIGLEHIFRTGLVHRDLKPSNLMLAIDGTVKIMDLGLARLRPDLADGDEAARPRCLMGTIDYMSPEQSKDASLADIRSDIYSLGCTLFKLLCGSPPFGGEKFETVQEKLHGHRKLSPPRLCELRADIPPALDTLMSRLLAKQPAARFSTPGELAEVLVPLAKGSDLRRLLADVKLIPQNGVADRSAIPNDSRSTVTSMLDESHAGALPSAAIDAGGKQASFQPMLPPANAAVRPRRSVHLSRVALIVLITAVTLGTGYGILKLRSSSVPIFARLPGFSGDMKFTKQLEKNGSFPWEGYRGLSHITVYEEEQVLQAGADGPQLIPLARYPGGAGRFRATVDQRPRWAGTSGIFMGLHKEQVKKRGVDKTMTVFQLISVIRDENPNRQGADAMRVQRRKVAIDPETGVVFVLDAQSKAEISKTQIIPLPQPLPVMLEVVLGREDILSISCNGILLDQLVSAKTDEWFGPQDYVGACGVFSYGDFGTKFSGVEITPFVALEKE